VSRKQVALKNLHVLDPVPGGGQPGPGQAIVPQLHTSGPEPIVADVLVHWGTLPARARVLAVLDRGKVHSAPPKKRAPARQFPASIAGGCDGRRALDRAHLYEGRGGKPDARVLAAGVVIPPNDWRAGAVRLHPPPPPPVAGGHLDGFSPVARRICSEWPAVLSAAARIESKVEWRRTVARPEGDGNERWSSCPSLGGGGSRGAEHRPFRHHRCRT